MSSNTLDFRTRLVCLLPTIAIVFNCLLSFFPRQSGLAVIKGGLFILILVYLYLGKFSAAFNRFAIFFLLVIYWFMLIPLSTGQTRSFEYILKNGIAILMLPLGYCYINTPAKISKFIYTQLNLLIIFVVFAILSNIFKWGVNQYGGSAGVRVGLYDAQLYCPASVLALTVFIFQTHKLDKLKTYGIYVLGVLAFAFLLLSLRRTTLLISFAGIAMFFTLRGKVNKLISLVISIAFVLVLTFPIYGDYLIERIAMRSNVFSSDYEMTDELRYQELFFVLKDLADNFSVGTLLFGKEIFNSPGHYGFTDGFLSIRQLHVDYTMLFHGTGLFGLCLYLGLFAHIVVLFNRRIRKFRMIFPSFAKDVKALFYTAVCLLLMIHFSGQMEELSFRSVLLLTAGSCLGVLYNVTARAVPVRQQETPAGEPGIAPGEAIKKLQFT